MAAHPAQQGGRDKTAVSHTVRFLAVVRERCGWLSKRRSGVYIGAESRRAETPPQFCKTDE